MTKCKYECDEKCNVCPTRNTIYWLSIENGEYAHLRIVKPVDDLLNDKYCNGKFSECPTYLRLKELEKNSGDKK
jgi:hypothetical protein